MENAPQKPAIPSTLKGLINYPPIREKFQSMLGEKKAATFLSSIISATETNNSLRECPPMNVIAQAAVAASLDLPINSSLAFAHLVPYSGRAQFQMGWRGYVQLAQRTGEYANMNASDVYEDELDFYNDITGEFKTTDPKTWTMRKAGMTPKIVGYVSFFKLLNGFEKFFYWTTEQCVAHGKRYSKAFQRNSGPWVDNQAAMCLKTVTKLLLSKWAPLSIDMIRAVQVDAAVVNKDLLTEGDVEKIEYPDAPEGSEPEAAPKVEMPKAATSEKTLAERWAGVQALSKTSGISTADLMKMAEAKEVTNANISDVEGILHEMIEQKQKEKAAVKVPA